MRFLGAQISVASDGLQIGQAKYVAQEQRVFEGSEIALTMLSENNVKPAQKVFRLVH